MKFDSIEKSIKYVKCIFQDETNNEYSKSATINFIGNNSLYLKTKDENFNFATKPKLNVKLNFICENGIYSTNSTLKSFQTDNKFINFSVDAPDELKYIQNREFFRVKMNNEVIVIDNERYDEFNAKIYDISCGGICIEQNINENTVIEPELIIKFNDKEVKINAEFIRKSNSKDPRKKLVAYKFKNSRRSVIDQIYKECVQKQLEDRRKIQL